MIKNWFIQTNFFFLEHFWTPFHEEVFLQVQDKTKLRFPWQHRIQHFQYKKGSSLYQANLGFGNIAPSSCVDSPDKCLSASWVNMVAQAFLKCSKHAWHPYLMEAKWAGCSQKVLGILDKHGCIHWEIDSFSRILHILAALAHT